MADVSSDWRIAAMPVTQDDARVLFEHLRDESKPDDATYDGWRKVYSYASTESAAIARADEIRADAKLLGIASLEVSLDQWLAEESRWSSDGTERDPNADEGSEEPKQGWLGTIIDGLLGGR